jgi:hypothetical protein
VVSELLRRFAPRNDGEFGVFQHPAKSACQISDELQYTAVYTTEIVKFAAILGDKLCQL